MFTGRNPAVLHVSEPFKKKKTHRTDYICELILKTGVKFNLNSVY